MADSIELRSDNAAGAAPEILAALAAANVGSALAYGADAWTERLQGVVRDVFEHPDARVFPVSSGIAANSVGLSAMCPPWGAVLCHDSAHVLRSEGGATSMLSGGAVMTGVGGEQHRVSTEALRAAFADTWWGDNHHSQPAVLSLTNPTDYGTVYTPAHVAALAAVARERGLRVHVDGARLANAIVANGCTPAQLTWQAGVDVFSLGAIKNGGVNVDAIVTFDANVAQQLHYRLKRAGHVTSKMRFQSVQLETYLRDGLWLKLAGNANRMMQRLATGLERLGVERVNSPDVNMVFVRMDEAVIGRLEQAGLLFYRMGPGVARFVTSWETTEAQVDDALARIGAAIG